MHGAPIRTRRRARGLQRPSRAIYASEASPSSVASYGANYSMSIQRDRFECSVGRSRGFHGNVVACMLPAQTVRVSAREGECPRMSLLGFFEWLAQTPASVAMAGSIWAFPIVESIHVLTLCLFLGMATILDLRLLGF